MIGGIPIQRLVNGIYGAIQGPLSSIITVSKFLLGAFLVLELLKSAIDIATQQTITIDKKILGYLMALMVIINYEYISQKLYKNSVDLTRSQIGKLVEITGKNLVQLRVNQYKSEFNQIPVPLVSEFNGMMHDTSFKLVEIIISIFFAVGNIILIGIYFGYACLLFLGPIFIPFFISSSTRSIGFHWLTNLISNYILFPLISITLIVCNNLLDGIIKSINQLGTKYDYNSIKFYWDLFIIALLPTMMIMAALQLSKTLVHGGSGGLTGGILQPLTAAMSVTFMAAKTAINIASAGKKAGASVASGLSKGKPRGM